MWCRELPCGQPGPRWPCPPALCPGPWCGAGGPRALGWGQEGTRRAAPSALRSSAARPTLCSLTSPAPSPTPFVCSRSGSQVLIGHRQHSAEELGRMETGALLLPFPSPFPMGEPSWTQVDPKNPPQWQQPGQGLVLPSPAQAPARLLPTTCGGDVGAAGAACPSGPLAPSSPALPCPLALQPLGQGWGPGVCAGGSWALRWDVSPLCALGQALLHLGRWGWAGSGEGGGERGAGRILP